MKSHSRRYIPPAADSIRFAKRPERPQSGLSPLIEFLDKRLSVAAECHSVEGAGNVTGKSKPLPRQQTTTITAFIDASQVYGSDAAQADMLRTHVGGKLWTNPEVASPGDTDAPWVDQLDLVPIGRAHDNLDLASMQMLFVREHNRIAEELQARQPNLTDEQIYRQARALVGAEMQAITYNEFLPALLGKNALAPYRGYKPNVDRETSHKVTNQIVDDLRSFLFGPAGAGRLDVAALNIQRRCDHGLADYNAVRAAYGLPRVTNFAQITSNTSMQQRLKQEYGDVNHIDLWVGAMAEDHLRGASVGPLVQRVMADQFQRLRDGDRFWYQRTFSGKQLEQLERTRLSDIVRRNTQLTNLPDPVFEFNPTISGRVFSDGNRDGKFQPMERGIADREVQLLNEDGELLQTTRTRPDGSYQFQGLELGAYQVRETLPQGVVQTAAPSMIQITSGNVVAGADFGEAPPVNRSRRPPAGSGASREMPTFAQSLETGWAGVGSPPQAEEAVLS